MNEVTYVRPFSGGYIMKKKHWILLSIVVLVLAIGAGIILYPYLTKESPHMSYPSFLAAVEKQEVSTVKISDTANSFQVSLTTEPDVFYSVPNPKTETFTEYLLTNNIQVEFTNDAAASNIIRIIVMLVIVGGVLVYRMRANSNTLIKNANKESEKRTGITLKQVAGNAEAKMMVEDIINFIKDPERYTSVGARMPRGILFYGPPGTGKTLMAKAIAGEAEVPFYAMSGSDFVQQYVGVGASRVRSLFKMAKKSEKAVIFIDEIDAIGKKRAKNASASNDERDQTLNALLTEMSGFYENSGIVVIAATNRMDTLDDALLRPGRFDRQIEIGLPDVNSRKKILSLHGEEKPFADDVNLDSLAKSTVSFSGAMLENLLNEAAINAANGGKSFIGQEHIDHAFYTVVAGAPKQDRSYITDHERKITAYHEAGHALANVLLLPENYISKVTIIPSVRGAGGFNLTIPKDTMFHTKRQLLGNIQVYLAGRIAEELIFGEDEITTGASNDIQRASTYIVDYINKYGMDDEMGLFSTEVLSQNADGQLVDKCRTMMNELYDTTRTLIKDNISLLEQITQELIEHESLTGEDIQRICA